MLSTAPLFSFYWNGREQQCICGEIAVSDDTAWRSGEGRGRLLARGLLEPFLLAAAADAQIIDLARALRGTRAQLWHAATDSRLCDRFAALLGAELGLGEPVELDVDADGLPAPLLELTQLARLQHQLAVAPASAPLGSVRDQLLAEPDWLGDAGSATVRLMRANPGRVLATLGADGLLAAALLPGHRAPAGIAVKLAASHAPEHSILALTPFLEALAIEPLPPPADGVEVRWHAQPTRLRPAPIDISPLLSERLAVWPGDVPFRRATSVESGPETPSGGPAWQLLVSSVHSTLHAGAHADAPNHVGFGGVGIDRVPIERYRGLCQVVRVRLPERGVLTPRDLGDRPPLAPRVLFATGSYPDPERFEPDFSALSTELVAWLVRHGTLLVGIDTPSIDPLSASELCSHRATREGAGLAILEGLVLDGVEPGLYELVALPLRIEGADASPVRAMLWPLR